MKKRLISMLMAVLMIASLLPAVALADEAAAETKCAHENTSVVTVTKVDAKNKVPGIKATVCDTCGEVQGVQIEKFSTSWLTCRKGCETNKIVEVQKAACGQFGLTVSYCEKCGKEFAVSELSSNPKEKAYYKAEAPLKHVYDAFTVVSAPACDEDGWGYVKCTICGDPQFVADADAALAKLSYVNYANAAAYQKRYNEVKDMFAMTNPGHTDTSKLVTVTKETTIVDNNGDTVTLEPATAYVHEKTISGTFDVKQGKAVATGETATVEKYAAKMNGDKIEFAVSETFGEKSAKTADKYCPSCHEVFNGVETGSKHVLGDTPKTLGYAPYLDKYGREHYGMTDVWECKTCKTTIGGEYLSYKEYFNPTDEDNIANGTTMTIPGYAASCANGGSKGLTDTTIVYNKTNSAWEVKYAATEIPAPAHKFADAVGVDPTCTEAGYIYKNYKICTVCGYGEVDKNDVVTIPALGHDYKAEALVPATCNSKGLSISKCANCGKYEKKDGAYVIASVDKVKEHVASDVLANVKAPTCVEKGYSGDVVCKYCNKVLTPGKELDMVDHTPVAVEAKEPTCTEPGLANGTVCSVCNKVLSAQKTVPALGHDYKNGVCTRCKAVDPNYNANPFKDVKKGDAFYDDIIWAANAGIVKGDENGNYNAKSNLTRGEVVTMLWRMSGSQKPTKAATFTDLTQNWYKDAVAWAAEEGIVNGVGGNKFNPDGNCTRAEFVTMLWRLNGEVKVKDAPSFTDLTQNWYKDAVAWAAANGITKGDGAGHFNPDSLCTRGEAAAFLHRADAISK